MREKRVTKSTQKGDYVYEFGRRRNRKPDHENRSPERKRKHAAVTKTRKKNMRTMHVEIENPEMTNPVQTLQSRPPKTPPASPILSPNPGRSIPSNLDRNLDPNAQNLSPTSTENVDSDGEVKNAIDKIYTSLNSGAAFSAGIAKFIRQKRSLNMHKQRRKIFPRRRFVTHQPSDTIMGDLVFYEGYKSANNNYKYILTAYGV